MKHFGRLWEFNISLALMHVICRYQHKRDDPLTRHLLYLFAQWFTVIYGGKQFFLSLFLIAVPPAYLQYGRQSNQRNSIQVASLGLFWFRIVKSTRNNERLAARDEELDDQ